jgi:hypothetical protein
VRKALTSALSFRAVVGAVDVGDEGSETGFFSLDMVCERSLRTEPVFDGDVMLVKDAVDHQGCSGND